jgi:hypothetical protein
MSAWFKAFWAKIDQDAKDIWNDSKVFFIIFAIVIAIVKFKDVLAGILVAGGKTTLDNAKKEDTALATQETQANTSADRLVEKAKEESTDKPPVDDNWNKS